MSAVMAEHITSNQHHDPAVGMHYMWNGSVDVSKLLNSLKPQPDNMCRGQEHFLYSYLCDAEKENKFPNIRSLNLL